MHNDITATFLDHGRMPLLLLMGVSFSTCKLTVVSPARLRGIKEKVHGSGDSDNGREHASMPPRATSL